MELPIADLDRNLEVTKDPFGQRHGFVGRSEVMGHDQELVATPAADKCTGTNDSAQPVGDFDEHVVAGFVAQSVVDALEVVDVDEQHR